jgi:hypothetical protein
MSTQIFDDTAYEFAFGDSMDNGIDAGFSIVFSAFLLDVYSEHVSE